jgi:hypothetical protein
MQYREFLRIERLKRILDVIAYGSLIIDVAITVVTLVSLNLYSTELSRIQYFLNIAVSIEVIVTFVLLVALAYLYHYEKIVDRLAEFSSMLTGRKSGKKR